MCQCLSFLVTHSLPMRGWVSWRRSLVLLFERARAWARRLTPTEVELFQVVRSANLDSVRRAFLQRMLRDGSLEASALPNGAMCKAKQVKGRDPKAIRSSNPTRSRKRDIRKQRGPVVNGTHAREISYRSCKNGGSDFASLFTRQGRKGINQDAMLVWEDFAAQADAIFCGVFDGHGPHGHLVARNVRDMLPRKLASCWQALRELRLAADEGEALGVNETVLDSGGVCAGDPQLISEWQESFLNAYKLVDRELLINDNVDCISSGTTAVALVKQGNDLIIGNVGDSRAVLGVRDDDNSLLALQLTIDLTPSLPKEAARIRQRRGRVFALRQEPKVKRVWLPHQNSPGLAMARALGDFNLKNFGVISVPEVTYRRLTEKDKFIVLATDGVWDVLSNEQVVEIVASTPVNSLAAKAVVDTAVRLWRSKYPNAKVDDCAAVCLFLDNVPSAVTNTGSLSKDDSPPSFIGSNSLASPLQVGVDQSGNTCDVNDGITTHQKMNGHIDQLGNTCDVKDGFTTHQKMNGHFDQSGNTCDVKDGTTMHQKMNGHVDQSGNACDVKDGITTYQKMNGQIEQGSGEETEETGLEAEEDVWSGLGGVTWANTLVNLPKFVPVAKRRYR